MKPYTRVNPYWIRLVCYSCYLLAVALLIACTGEKQAEEKSGTVATESVHESTLTTYEQKVIKPIASLSTIQKQNTLQPLLKRYLLLKNALVASRADSAVIYAYALAGALEKQDTAGLYTPSGVALAKHIREVRLYGYLLAQQTQLPKQRQIFFTLSQHVYALVLDVGGSSQPLYWQYCPMYKTEGNKGAHWLSVESTIMNPYFGDEMLNCGEVQVALRFE